MLWSNRDGPKPCLVFRVLQTQWLAGHGGPGCLTDSSCPTWRPPSWRSSDTPPSSPSLSPTGKICLFCPAAFGVLTMSLLPIFSALALAQISASHFWPCHQVPHRLSASSLSPSQSKPDQTTPLSGESQFLTSALTHLCSHSLPASTLSPARLASLYLTSTMKPTSNPADAGPSAGNAIYPLLWLPESCACPRSILTQTSPSLAGFLDSTGWHRFIL